MAKKPYRVKTKLSDNTTMTFIGRFDTESGDKEIPVLHISINDKVFYQSNGLIQPRLYIKMIKRLHQKVAMLNHVLNKNDAPSTNYETRVWLTGNDIPIFRGVTDSFAIFIGYGFDHRLNTVRQLAALEFASSTDKYRMIYPNGEDKGFQQDVKKISDQLRVYIDWLEENICKEDWVV